MFTLNIKTGVGKGSFFSFTYFRHFAWAADVLYLKSPEGLMWTNLD